MELSQAAIDYGKAFCLSPDRAGLDLAGLTDVERSCVERVAQGFESRVQERLGLAPVDGIGYPVVSPAGAKIATLGMDPQGRVTLCLPGARCVELGSGPAVAAAAEEVLSLQGFSLSNVQGPAAGA